MSYKYYRDRAEDAHGYINRMTFLSAEYCREQEGYSEVVEDFFNQDYEDIAKTLRFKTDEETKKFIETEIEDNSAVVELCRNNRDGFLAEVYIPECSQFSFKEDGKPSSWAVNGGVMVIRWIYADTIGELLHKLEEVSNEEFQKMVDKGKDSE